MELIFLGTGAGIPNTRRNVSATALCLNQEQQGVWLFDCGEATQHQMMRSPVSPRQLEKIFISHLHGDHLFGLPGVLGTRSFQGARTPLHLYGPPGIREFVAVTMRLSQTHIEYDLHITEVSGGECCCNEAFTVSCLELAHVIPSFGYRIVEKDRPGALNIQALKAANIPPGPLYTQLKKGRTIVLPDGRQVDGNDFLSAPKPGRIITLIGDTAFCEASIALAQGADLLLHESTFIQADREAARTWGHSTSQDAAEVARAAGAKQLVLNHISGRYDQAGLQTMLQEAQSVFPPTRLAEDFTCIDIKAKPAPA